MYAGHVSGKHKVAKVTNVKALKFWGEELLDEW